MRFWKPLERNELTMITVPKPRFAKTNVPIGVSLEDYRDHIADLQFHILGDAIDRVSRRNRDAVV